MRNTSDQPAPTLSNTQQPQRNAYQNVTLHYDDILTARKWWSKLYMKWLWRTDDNQIADEVLHMIPDDLDGALLDVPVGTAVFTQAKYSRLTRARITGLDYSEAMLQLARNKMEARGLKHVKLMQGDVGKLPFTDESFDYVLSMNGLHTFPDKPKALDEIHRVLKRGGVFCGCFYISGQRCPADWVVRHVLDKKGFFLAPHFDLEQAVEQLRRRYGSHVYVKNYRSMLVFRCFKAPGNSLVELGAN